LQIIILHAPIILFLRTQITDINLSAFSLHYKIIIIKKKLCVYQKVKPIVPKKKKKKMMKKKKLLHTSCESSG
jgi:hypothetical protein